VVKAKTTKVVDYADGKKERTARTAPGVNKEFDCAGDDSSADGIYEQH